MPKTNSSKEPKVVENDSDSESGEISSGEDTAPDEVVDDDDSVNSDDYDDDFDPDAYQPSRSAPVQDVIMKLKVPEPENCFGLTTSPPTEKYPDCIQYSARFLVGFADTIGSRSGMEDTHSILGQFGGSPDKDVFLLFDGHSGSLVSDYANVRFPAILKKKLASKNPEKALRETFLETNAAVFEKNLKGGCTATAVLVLGDRAYVAHVGDSRAAIVHSDGKLERLTVDHRPDNEAEAAAVKSRGGFVFRVGGGVGRVNGVLAITRALGDRDLKDAITAEPDIRQIPKDLLSKDSPATLVVACDGMWDVLTDEYVAEVVSTTRDLKACAQILRNRAYDSGSADNITVMVFRLNI